MLPRELFRSRQFASANLLALVTYAALGGVIFLRGGIFTTWLARSPRSMGHRAVDVEEVARQHRAGLHA